MREKKVGVYEFGWEKCEISLRPGYGDEYGLAVGEAKTPWIRLGADAPQWWQILAVLVHESMEYALGRLGCRYEQAETLTGANDRYLFVFEHTRFSEACCRAGEFLAACAPAVAKEWNAWQKELKKSKKSADGSRNRSRN